MKVEIQPDVRDMAAPLGAGVPYALKVLAGQLADDPDMGRPSGLPGILTVTVDGDVFEDCPDLSVGYIREPDRIEIRFLRAVPSADPSTDAQDQEQGRDQDQPADPAAAAVTAREVADAWRRITGWLKHNAPDSYAALRAGADPAAIAAVEGDLGIRIPVELHVRWLLTAGDDGGDGWGCLPGNKALMTVDAVAAVHRLKMDSQAHEDALMPAIPRTSGSPCGRRPGFRWWPWARLTAPQGCIWTPRAAAWAGGPVTTRAPVKYATPWSPTWKRLPTCSKPRPWPRGTARPDRWGAGVAQQHRPGTGRPVAAPDRLTTYELGGQPRGSVSGGKGRARRSLRCRMIRTR